MKYNRQSTRALHTGSKRWREIRAQVLTEQPLCPRCMEQGRIEPAVEVDHRDNNSHNNERSNLEGLCVSHHSAKSFAEARGLEVKIKGCDVNGYPLDPSHHWNSHD